MSCPAHLEVKNLVSCSAWFHAPVQLTHSMQNLAGTPDGARAGMDGLGELVASKGGLRELRGMALLEDLRYGS